MIGIVAFLIWAGGSGYWYACKIKGACSDSPQEVMTQDGGEPEQLAEDAEGTAEEATDMNSGEEAAIAEFTDEEAVDQLDNEELSQRWEQDLVALTRSQVQDIEPGALAG